MLNLLRNLFILSLLFVAINANGKFAVLNAPSSLDFQGNDPILGEDVGEIVSAAIGGTVNGDAHWSGFTVVDPFNLPKKAVVALIDGLNIDITPAKFEYPVEGSGALDSLNLLVADMKAVKTPTCHVDYSSKKAKSANKCFGITAVSDSTILPKTSSLNPVNEIVSNFLQAIGDLNGAVDNYSKQKDTKNVEMKDVTIVRLSLAPIVNAYGAKSAEVKEATDLVKKSIAKLQKASGDALFIVVSGVEEKSSKSRAKREVLAGDAKKNPYNLAKYYDGDYPVIFNIILWFMVVFALALLAISYAIGSMDPGRDSIIYRMTSTRMKKDN